ncbi:MAG: VCBS repeat-containing protein, partial [Gemmataceae bacterium]|nr:VCBS repeat-containing protein [Gemmataceae bacterium]
LGGPGGGTITLSGSNGGHGGDGGDIEGIGIYLGYSNPLAVITNSTIAQNLSAIHAGVGGNGGNGGPVLNPGAGGTGGNGGSIVGAGIHVVTGTTTIVNSTISTNIAQAPGLGGLGGLGVPPGIAGLAGISEGGGVYNFLGDVSLFNTTIALNESHDQGGGVANNALLTLTSTIIGDNNSLNTNVEDLFNNGLLVGPPSFNLIESPNGHTIANGVNGNLVGLSPNLGPLQNNGGPTLTHLPNFGSPAINNGSNPLVLTFDQRGVGFPRNLGGQTDIGATEFGNPLGTPIYAIGAGPGALPEVNVYDALTGTLKFSFLAYAPTFTGGVRVAVGDYNGDGVLDIITGAGTGGGPHVRVFNGTNLAILASFYAYAPTFTGGIFVAAGDINNDGLADIVTGAGQTGGPHVRVFSGGTAAPIYSFYAYAPNFTGGVSVAVGDINGDSFADIITGAGPGGGPHVRVFNGTNLAILASFFAYAPTFIGGVFVGSGRVNLDAHADIIVGPGPGAGPNVRVFDGSNPATILHSFNAYVPTFSGGVRVGSVDTNGSDLRDLLTGPGPTGGPNIKIFDGLSLALLDSFYAFNPLFLGGTFVNG